MGRNQNQTVSEMMTKRLEELLSIPGAFPRVQFKHVNGCKSFSMFEYMEVNGRLGYLIHEKLVAAGYVDGIWASRLRSKAYIGAAEKALKEVTVEQIKAANKRFATWMD